MTTYLQHFTKPVPQNEQARDDEVQNSAGGFVFAVDPFVRLRRFLILGAEGGSYYAGERQLVLENAKCVQECLRLDGERTVREIVEVSEGGRAPKQAPGIFALALACKYADAPARRLALRAVPRVCRTGSTLQEFTKCLKAMRSFGAGVRRAFAHWYNDKTPQALAYQLCKYRQRDGVSHRDILRLARVKPVSDEHNALFRWACGVPLDERWVKRRITHGTEVHGTEVGKHYPNLHSRLPGFVEAFDELQRAESVKDVVHLVGLHDFTWEMVPTEHLKSTEVWEALLPKMPITALLRNLGRITALQSRNACRTPVLGMVTPMGDTEQLITSRLTDMERITKGRVHPLSVLVALNTYQSGRGVRGKLSWTPSRAIIDALDAMFYMSFGAVEPTGKRRLIALDVSGSMGGPEIAGMPGITPRVGAAAMAMVTMRTEKSWHTVAFSAGGQNPFAVRNSERSRVWGGRDGISQLNISAAQRLDDVLGIMQKLPFGGTDVALPMLYAAERNIPVDCFEVYTDNESWAGDVHPWVALESYRQKMGIDAKLVCVAMVANNYSVADPRDPRQLDVVGFDTSVPAVMSAFIGGHLAHEESAP